MNGIASTRHKNKRSTCALFLVVVLCCLNLATDVIQGTEAVSVPAQSKRLHRYPTVHQNTRGEYTDAVLRLQRQHIGQKVSHKMQMKLFDLTTDNYHDAHLLPSYRDNPRTVTSVRTHQYTHQFLGTHTTGFPVGQHHQYSSISSNTNDPYQASYVEGYSMNQNINIFSIQYGSNVPANVRAVVSAASQIWSDSLGNVTVPITVKISWVSKSSQVLASAGPSYVYYYTTKGMYYPASVLSQLVGESVDPDHADFVVEINSAFPKWHYSLVTSPPSGMYDMLSTMLHEFGHGLGFVGFISATGNYPLPAPYVFDRYVYTGMGTPVIPTTGGTIGSTPMWEAFKNRPIYFWEAVNHQSGFLDENNARLYNPSSFSPGSSVYHLDELTYPDDADALMTPMINAAERVLYIGTHALNIMDTLGWNVRNCSEYSDNCFTCTSAGCFWCHDKSDARGFCTASLTKNEVCQTNADFIQETSLCPDCDSDAHCDDSHNECVSGFCDALTGRCTTVLLDCRDQYDCNVDYCDAQMGCVHYYPPLSPLSPPSCGGAAALCTSQDCAICKDAEERVEMRSPLTVVMGVDIPPIPQGFFGPQSNAIHRVTVRFNWCSGDKQYLSLLKRTSVFANATVSNRDDHWHVADVHSTYLHMCSIDPILVTYSNSDISQLWSVEAFLSGSSLLNAFQKSRGSISYQFNSCKSTKSAILNLEAVLGFAFYHGAQKRQLDFNVPRNYRMPLIPILENAISTNTIIGSNFINIYKIA